MTAFQLAYKTAMDHEGSYSNDPRDRGGETYCGISRVHWAAWEGWELIDKVKKTHKTDSKIAKALKVKKELVEMVEGFYKANFWDVLRLDELENEPVTTELFEQGVNQGLNTAARHLQHALNLLNNNQKYYADLRVDGKAGQRTVKAYRAFMQTASMATRSPERNTKTLLKVLNALQFDRYRDLCNAKPDQEVFLYGWLNRV